MKFLQIVGVIVSCLLIIQGQDDTWKNEIIEGNCEDKKEDDLVLLEHVVKEGDTKPREALVIWSNEEFRIYCIQVENLRPTSGCRVRLDGGGIGEDFVRVDMQSQPSNGLEFNITIFAIKIDK